MAGSATTLASTTCSLPCSRGAYVSLDGIGSNYWGPTYGGYDVNIAWIEQLVAAGYEDKIIIGADTGWFDPGFPPGFKITQLPDGSWVHDPDDQPQYMQDYRSVPARVRARDADGRVLRGAHQQAHAFEPVARVLPLIVPATSS